MTLKETEYKARLEKVDPDRLVRVLAGWTYEEHLRSYSAAGDGRRENEWWEWIFTSSDEKLRLIISKQKPVDVNFSIGRHSQFSAYNVKKILVKTKPSSGWTLELKGSGGLEYSFSTSGSNLYQSETAAFRGRERLFRVSQEIDLRKKIIVVEDGRISSTNNILFQLP